MDLNTTKVSRFVFVIWVWSQSLWRLFCRTVSIDLGLWELAWEPFGRQGLTMCEKVAKMTSPLRLLWGCLVAQSRVQRGVRTAQSHLGQSRRRGQNIHFEIRYSNKMYFLKCVEHIWNTWVFQEFGRVRAPKLGPLEPKSRAQERSGQPKVALEGPVREIRTIKNALDKSTCLSGWRKSLGIISEQNQCVLQSLSERPVI